MEKDEDTEKREGKKIFSAGVVDRSRSVGLDVRRQAIGKEEVFCRCLPLATKPAEEEEEEEKRTPERHLITHTNTRYTRRSFLVVSLLLTLCYCDR